MIINDQFVLHMALQTHMTKYVGLPLDGSTDLG